MKNTGSTGSKKARGIYHLTSCIFYIVNNSFTILQKDIIHTAPIACTLHQLGYEATSPLTVQPTHTRNYIYGELCERHARIIEITFRCIEDIAVIFYRISRHFLWHFFRLQSQFYKNPSHRKWMLFEMTGRLLKDEGSC